MKAAGATEVVVEYDELPRAALELLSSGKGPAQLERFTNLASRVREWEDGLSGPSTRGMKVDELRRVADEVH